MRIIPLERIANQTVEFFLDDSRWVVTLKETTHGRIAATIERDNEVVIASGRCVAGTPLLPYDYMETGNLIFLTEAGERPSWPEFGLTQTLLYVTAEEVASV